MDSVVVSKFLKSSSISDVMICSLRGAILRPLRLWIVFPLPNIPKIEFPAGPELPELLEGRSKVLVELDISFFAKYGLKYAVLKLFFSLDPTNFQTNFETVFDKNLGYSRQITFDKKLQILI